MQKNIIFITYLNPLCHICNTLFCLRTPFCLQMLLVWRRKKLETFTQKQEIADSAGLCRRMSKVYGNAKVLFGQNRSVIVSTPFLYESLFLLKKHVRQIEARQNHKLCISSQKSFISKTFPTQVEEQGTRIVSWLQVEGLHIISAGGQLIHFISLNYKHILWPNNLILSFVPNSM